MDSNFLYLEKYIPGGRGIHDNFFYKISEFDIHKAEKLYGHSFPSQLKQFYREIGPGMLRCPNKPPVDYSFSSYNEFIHPMAMVGFTQGQRLNDEYQHYMDQSVMDDLEPGDLPFFEVGDSCQFMIMKAFSDNPNAVYSQWGDKISDSLYEFVHNLYYKSTYFYDDIIEEYYEKLKDS